jgi:PAS domain S-box-containing protein
MIRRTLRFLSTDLHETLGSNPVAVLAGVGVILVALVVMVSVTLLAENAADSRRDKLAEELEPFAFNLSDLEVRLLNLSADLRGYALTRDEMFRVRYLERRATLTASLARVRESAETAGFSEPSQAVVRDTISYLTTAEASFQAAERGEQQSAESLIASSNTERLDAASASIAGVQSEVQVEIASLRERIQDIDAVERYVLFLAGPLGIIAAGVLVWLALTNQRLLRIARTEQARFTSIVNSLSRYGICQTNAKGEIEFCNPAAAEMLGHDVTDLIGKPLHEMTHNLRADGSPYAISDCEIERVRSTGVSHKGQDSFVLANGGILPVDVTSEPIRVNGSITGAVIAFEDITQRLKQEQFRQQFVSFASHELRTPLMIMSGYAQLLTKRLAVNPNAFDERSREAIGELEEGITRMRKITEVVLDLTRVQSGQSLRPEAETVDLRDLLEKETESTRVRYPATRIDLVLPEGESFVESDGARLGQAVANLLDNAAKYGGDPARVTVKVERDDSRVTVRVSDGGPGIPAEEQPLVFEQFYRGATASHKQGLGVGLFITKRSVEQLGGTLRFESEQGRGTEFTLTLPVQPDGKA